MRHVIDMALKTEYKIEESKPDNVAEQLPYAFRLKSELAKVQHADQSAGDAKDCS